MSMLKRLGIVALLFCFMISVTACWDKLEIEKRAFILGIAIDKAEEEGKVAVTFQIALPQAFGAEGGDTEAYWNITEVAPNITSARRMLIRSINWIPTFEHCQMLFIGEELAKEGLADHLDFFFRTYDVRRRMEVAVVQGSGKDALEMEFKSEKVPAFFIAELKMQNSKESFEVTDYTYLGRLHERYVLQSDFILSRLVLHGNEHVDASGAAVFKDFKFAGWFSGEELMHTRFLRGDMESGILGMDLPEELGQRIMLRIFDVQTSLRPEIRNDQLYAVSKIRVEGDIEELGRSGISFDPRVIREIEGHVQSNLEAGILRTFLKAQREFEADPFHFDDKVMNYMNRYWRDNNQNWNEIYQTVELDIEVEVRIRRVGEVNYQ